MKIISVAFTFCLISITGAFKQEKNNKTIQLNISSLLNARPVTTLFSNKLVTWTKGIDGNGIADGYLTLSAALFNGDIDPHALPDKALFPANGSHPEIKLHYSNNDSLHNQACSISGEGDVEFAVPGLKYKAVYLALTSAEGPSYLNVRFLYADNSKVSEDFVLPDYYKDIPADYGKLDFCYLAHDLAKWGNKNNMTEKNHHNIDLVKILPDPARILKTISIQKTKPGYLVFWAATGVKAN
jgi:hypothetical protein